MKRNELYASIGAVIGANRLDRDDLVYLERRGDDYEWRVVPTDGAVTPGKPEPDAWMSFCATWPDDPERLQAFLDDLLAELEAGMSAPADRCRWPTDQPWPHFH